jgi:hypothetical protein
MRQEAQHLWARARECRIKAQLADETIQKRLLEEAEQLEAEATRIEAETPEPS